jgi:DNA-binding NarL/FixJ family response regulator
VLLCDDHAVVREGTRRLLEDEPDIEVVGEASDGLEAIEMVRELSPHVVAMDVSMPRMNGIEATRRIKQMAPSVFILALTAYDDFAYVASLLEGGASGYILKSARSPELIAAIRATALGESILDAKVAKEVFGRIAQRSSMGAQPARAPAGSGGQPAAGGAGEGPVRLTGKEMQVLRFAASGQSNKEIARKLYLSPRTVQTHLAAIFSKMGVASRTEAVIKALKTGLLSQADIEVGQDE